MTQVKKTCLTVAALSALSLLAAPAWAQTESAAELAAEAAPAQAETQAIEPTTDMPAEPAMTPQPTPYADASSEGWDGADLAEAPAPIQNEVNDGNYTTEDLNRAMLATLRAQGSET
jgi:hypothetical protein